MADHDQRLKMTVREFLAEFADLVMPSAWPGRFDFTRVQWLEQEVFPDPPQGERRLIDLLARMPVTQAVAEASEALVHIEIEARDSLTDLRTRMPRYHHFLGFKYNLPVLSLGLYLNVGLDGVGWDKAEEEFWEEKLSDMRWRYLGLPALDALQYVEGANILGVALSAQMRVPEDRQVWLKAQALKCIGEAQLSPYRMHLLMTMVEAYLPLDGPRMQEYQQLLLTEEFAVVRILEKTTYEKGVEQGEESGLIKGRRQTLRDLLDVRFGPLSETAVQRLEAASMERLQELTLAFVDAESLADLGLEDSPNGQPPTP